MPDSPVLFDIHEQTLSHGSVNVVQLKKLQISTGEKIALLGVSGSGKSTLLAFLYNQQKGRIAYCPQKLGLVPILSVFHNVYMAQLHNHSTWHNLLNLIKPQKHHVDAIQSLIHSLGLDDKLFTSVDQLSGGQQQRTALARALYAGNDIFIGDEPVSAIDEIQSNALVDKINHHYQTSIVALHNRHLALTHFDRVIGLKNGAIVIDQPSESLTSADITELYSV